MIIKIDIEDGIDVDSALAAAWLIAGDSQDWQNQDVKGVHASYNKSKAGNIFIHVSKAGE